MLIIDGGKLTVKGCRIKFRQITASEHDTALVCKWRNTPEAREAFFNKQVVTPDTHRMFLENREPHDIVWIVETRNTCQPIGMTALKIEPSDRKGEYGRTYVDKDYRGKGYAKELEFLLVCLAFEYFSLNMIWLEAYTANEAIIKLHEKTGWTTRGENNGVTGMVYNRSHWSEKRQLFPLHFKGVELPVWE